MLLSFLPAALITAVTARSLALPPVLSQEPLKTPPLHDAEHHRMPTVYESTIMARRILAKSSIATLVTTFPATSNPLSQSEDDETHVFEIRPAEMQGNPIGLMEYYADCEPSSGNPTLLAINIATPYRNYAAGSNISMEIRWWPAQTNHYSTSLKDEEEEERDIPTPHTPAALPRFSLHGHLEAIPVADLATHLIPACFLKSHPDSVLWQPGNDIHTSQYVRFVVEHIYWFGGFGDRAQIGWLPIEGWRNVTVEEVEGMKLPGE